MQTAARMTSDNPVVECADRARALNSQHTVRLAVLTLLIPFGCHLIGLHFGKTWFGVVGILLAGRFVIFPHIMREHRFYTSLQCPHCQQPAGRYLSRQRRIYLHCQHCGQESPTDCMIPWAGGPPCKL